ncbi:STAS/SEC14 domain-containing protein [candidate division WOR-3 bacterium]|nr:STAS/SEC14 domain-containing protein [candidate division WOR-3 bacterium]
MEKYKLSYNDEDDILCLKIFGVITGEDLREMMPMLQKILDGKPRRYVLIDMSHSVQAGPNVMTKEMREAYKEMTVLMDSDKSAIFGASPVVRMAAKIALAVTKRWENTRFFKTEEEAVAWLKKEDSDEA